MIKTFNELLEFNVAATNWLQKTPTNPQTKLGYALNKVGNNQVSDILKEFSKVRKDLYEEEVHNKQIDLALTDKNTGAVLNAPQGSKFPYIFDKDGLKQMAKIQSDYDEKLNAVFEEYKKKEYTIEPHYAVELPEDLTAEEIAAFTGFVIAPTE